MLPFARFLAALSDPVQAHRYRRRVVSAGGIVVRGRGATREVLLVSLARGVVTFPKGRVERGETWEAAAEREVLEEAGVRATTTSPAGDLRYLYRDQDTLVSKVVHLYLMTWQGGQAKPDGLETVEACFIPETKVEESLSYEGERAVWLRARELLQERQGTDDVS